MAQEPETTDTGAQVSEPTAADAEGRDKQEAVDETDAVDEADAADEADVVDETTAVDEIEAKGGESEGTRLRDRFAGRQLSRVGSALLAGAVIVAALAGLVGWLGYRTYQRHEAQAQRDQFVQVARQGAVNLTTISYTEVDADVQRIIDLSTGAFREDFQQRSKPFIEVVKAAQSKSEGTVTDAGLESQKGNTAQVLVAIAVKSRTSGGEEAPREWRMRVEVQSVGDDAKVSNVVFVP
ncbi:Mce associated membrane protein [Mycobacterium numidiamassiliense]|uniref:Mce associated membrane protein n=1 Tax=Mycobacterium numidiamassiliense TaxID=1841861 RepID=A0A2U3PDQ2_9MYCO|nr:Mce protein [Mycobacterium numidiamassiliense]SPM41872.1 Mce associated membrane protein [Mycobacterium numidiamassiliense]